MTALALEGWCGLIDFNWGLGKDNEMGKEKERYRGIGIWAYFPLVQIFKETRVLRAWVSYYKEYELLKLVFYVDFEFIKCLINFYYRDILLNIFQIVVDC